MPTLNWLNRPAAFDTAAHPKSDTARPAPVEGQTTDNLLIELFNLCMLNKDI
ncbi:MAG: hypothetical protein QM533_12665 [Cytophagales bacterium]|nr:hypothetical protein [Cytophagales bacterium]